MSHLLIHRGLAKKKFTENTISSFKYCFDRNLNEKNAIKTANIIEVIKNYLKTHLKLNKLLALNLLKNHLL